MKVYALPLGDYQTNCYIVHDENRRDCFVIDPGYQAEDILDFCKDKDLTIAAVLLTHGHFDHVGAVKELAAETGCRVYLCAEDLSMPGMMTGGRLYYTHTYGEGDELDLAGLRISVLHTPGHTPGSVCLLADNALFSGDTLFAGSCGRTDLPGGSWATIVKSLRRLSELEGDFPVYPGHGESTSLAEEKRYNPYL